MAAITEKTRLEPSTSVQIDVMPERRRFTPDEYLRMAEVGVLKPAEKTELICGEVRTMLPTGRPHWVRVAELVMRLSRFLPSSDWCVVSQSTIEVNDSMPEPDIVVLRGNSHTFLQRDPKPEEIALVIEVADSSLSFDRGSKLALYASAGVSDYWIVNIRDKQIETYSSPEKSPETSQFRTVKTFRQGELATHTFSGDLLFTIEVNDLFASQP